MVSFTGERGNLVFGHAVVSIPRIHQVGEIEKPSRWRLQFQPDPNSHFTIANAAKQSPAEWAADVKARVDRDPSRALLLFVHGYNVSFEDALMRTAQIEHDTDFGGPAVLFSWPSKATSAGYPADEDSVRWTTPHLAQVIRYALATSAAKEVYLIAHSMGNRALTDTLVELGRTDPSVRSKVREVVLAAPDIDADIFKRDLAPKLLTAAQRVTMYASNKDWALTLSRKFHKDQRAGETLPSIVVQSPIQTIDVSNLSADFLGHSYIGQNETVLSDLRTLFAHHGDPTERGMLSVGRGDGRYWRFPTR